MVSTVGDIFLFTYIGTALVLKGSFVLITESKGLLTSAGDCV